MALFFVTDLIPTDILNELKSVLSDYTGSDISIENDLPDCHENDKSGKDDRIIAPLILNGQEAGFIVAENIIYDEKNSAFIEGIARVLSKILYHRYLLMQQNESMEKSIRSQSEFLTQFADDVKKSVSGMFLYLSDSSNEDRESEIKKTIDVLMARTLKLGNMVDGGMDYVEAVNGVFELNEAVYDIRDVVENQISRNMERALEKNDTLTYTFADDIPERLMGDPGHVGTILGKLIENAVHYSENSFVKVMISTEFSTYGVTLVISVADGGVGIEPSQAEYIKSYMESRGFSDAKNEEFEMLGFSLIGFCVNAMSGSIELSSKQGSGTEFVIRLPQLAVEGGTKNEF